MQKVKADDVVKVHYTGKLENGEVFDTSENREPLEFKVGTGQMIQGFDNAVVGMELNESKTVTIPPEQAYGTHDPQLVQELSKTVLAKDIEPKVGMELVSSNEQGQSFKVTISKILGDTIEINANHQLAGKPLTFDIKLVEIAG